MTGTARAPFGTLSAMVGAFVMIGLAESSLGVAWPSMRESFGQPLAALAFLLYAMTGGYLAASLVLSRLVNRIDTGPLLVVAPLCGVVGALVIAAAPALAMAVPGAFLLGVASAGVDGRLNTYTSVHLGSHLLNVMHGGFGVGAFGGPLGVTALVAAGVSWRWAYGGLAAYDAALAAGFLLLRHRWRPLPTLHEPAVPAAMGEPGVDDAVPDRVEVDGDGRSADGADSLVAGGVARGGAGGVGGERGVGRRSAVSSAAVDPEAAGPPDEVPPDEALLVEVPADEALPGEADLPGRPPTTAPPGERPPGRGPRLVAVLAVAGFFTYTGVEVSCGYWAFELLTTRGLSTGAAGVVTSIYWGSLMVGRFVLGALGPRARPAPVLALSAAGAVVGTLVIAAGGGLWPEAAAAGFVLTGVALSGIFPAMVAMTPVRLGPVRAARLMGVQLAAASLGVATIPSVVGVVAQRRGSAAIAPALVLAAAVFAAVHVAVTVASRRSGPADREHRRTSAAPVSA